MRIGILNEQGENRVALIPDTIKKLTGEGFEIWVEDGAGEEACYSNQDFENAGASVKTQNDIISQADILVTIHPLENYSEVKNNAVVVSLFKPLANTEVYDKLGQYPVTAFSMDMMPRSTIAQDKDVLSSMASVAGYRAVLEAATLLPRYFPMMTTAAGSIPPAKVMVIGAGVAGLQAIATSRRLGAQVEAFDVRTAAKEEVQSIGAKFIEVEGAKEDKSAGGYAVEQTEDFKERQKQTIHEHVKKSDVVLTTAQVRGSKAPQLVTQPMVEDMKPGSVIIDIAASTGGNCELTQNNKLITHKGVKIYGNSTLEAEIPMHASQLFSKNIYNFLKVIVKEGQFHADFENDIIHSTCLVHEGQSRKSN